MDLTKEQRQAVQQWVAGGASLFEVQKRLKSDFGLGMTYMDVRFLVLDLGAQVKDKPEPRKVAPPPEEVPADEEALDAADDGAPGAPDPLAGPGAGAVSVTLDRIVRPGAVVSGSVTFSDGVTAKWVLDQTGRLGLDGTKPNYRPPAQDIQDFQNQLRTQLQSRGF